MQSQLRLHAPAVARRGLSRLQASARAHRAPGEQPAAELRKIMIARNIARLVRLLLSAAVVALVGTGEPLRAETSAGDAASSPERLQSDIAYGPDPQQKLDLCLPASSGAGAHAAVLLIHGGGWAHGDRRGYGGFCRLAAASGIVGISMDYRLADGLEARWPAQLIDAQLAMRWVKVNATRLGIDPTKVCALGDSAGAHLAVFLGVLRTSISGKYADLYKDASPQAACVIDQSGPVNFVGLQNVPRAMLFGAEAARDGALAEMERRASPIFAVGPQAARMLIIHGTQDDLVPLDQAQQLHDALKRSGVAVKFVEYAGGHGLAGQPPDKIMAIERQDIDFILESAVAE